MRLVFALALGLLWVQTDRAAEIKAVTLHPGGNVSPETLSKSALLPASPNTKPHRDFASNAVSSAPYRTTRVTRIVYSLGELATPLPSPNVATVSMHNPSRNLPALQIGAYQNEANAQTASLEFNAQYGNASVMAAASIQKVDLGAKGVWYRLRVGPFADRAVAMTTCAKLKAHGASCIMVTDALTRK